MGRHGNPIFGLLSAAAFYGFFGVAVPRHFAPEAATSITPAVQGVVAVLALVVVAISLRRFLGSDTE